MINTELKGNWSEHKGILKQKFAILMDNDLIYEEGKKDELIGKLEIKFGKKKKNGIRF